MTHSITLLAQDKEPLQLPRALTRSLRGAVLGRLAQISGGALRIHEPDGNTETIGAASGPVHDVVISHWSVYAYMALGGTTGAGQAWILGLWHTDALVDVVRLMVRNRAAMESLDGGLAGLRTPIYRLMEWQRRNSRAGSRRNIAAHYDLGNDFFALFLDETMAYSSAVFPSRDAELLDAQRHKYDLVCRKLDLAPGDTLVEIGSGWGGLAIHAARHYGAQVTTTTISRAQHELACRRVAEAGLSDQITVLLKDYRELEGTYDKLVSIEMIEAVGHEYLPDYFQQIDRLLKPHGQALIQAITIRDQYYDKMRRGTDFIREFIFPGGLLPSVQNMVRVSGSHTSLQLFHLDDFGKHYAETLRRWRRAFKQQIHDVKGQGYSEPFQRMWDFYLAACEAGFEEGSTGVVHALFVKPDCKRPPVTATAGQLA